MGQLTSGCSRQCLPQLPHHRLTDLAEYFHISTQGAHRALNDCRMNQRCYEALGKLLGEQPDVSCPKTARNMWNILVAAIQMPLEHTTVLKGRNGYPDTECCGVHVWGPDHEEIELCQHRGHWVEEKGLCRPTV